VLQRPASDLLQDYLLESELAIVLDLNPRTLRKLDAPKIRIGRRTLYRRQAIQEWLLRREAEGAR